MSTQTHKKPTQQSSPQDDPAYESSDWETDENTKEPTRLSTVKKRKDGAAMDKALSQYQVGASVKYEGGKGPIGPYTISAVYSNNTYDLKNGPLGNETKLGVKQSKLI